VVDEDFRRAWAKRAGDYFVATFGLARLRARLLAWLMICEPAGQSGSDLAAALGVSRASITTSLRLAQSARLITRRTRSGDRTVYYVIDDNAWHEVLRRRITSMATFAEIAGEAIDQMEADGQPATRIRAARDIFAWLGTLAGAPTTPTRTRRPNR
jgi:predicted transcriptional regulator